MATNDKRSNHQTAIRFAHQVAQRLVDLAQPKPGDTVLDVATGAGVAALYAAGQVTPLGRVIGVDQPSPWLDYARRRLAAVGASHVFFVEGELVQLDFADSTFDCLLCSSAIFLLPDMAAGLREWRRVLKPGGTVAFSGYGKRSFQPLVTLLETCLRRYDVNIPPQPFAWQQLTDLEAFSELLRSAAFSGIDVRSEQLGNYLMSTDEWWDLLWLQEFCEPLRQLSPDALSRFKAEHLAEVAQLATARGIWLNVTAVFAVGQKG